MTLASRQQEQANGNLAALAAAGRGFQSLALDNALSSLSGGSMPTLGGAPGGGSGDISSLPMNGAAAEGPTESVSITGAQGRSQDFGNGNEQDIEERIQEFRDRVQREGGGLQGGGPGGAGGGAGGPGGLGGGGPFLMRLPRGFNINQPSGRMAL